MLTSYVLYYPDEKTDAALIFVFNIFFPDIFSVNVVVMPMDYGTFGYISLVLKRRLTITSILSKSLLKIKKRKLPIEAKFYHWMFPKKNYQQ